jgi:hypothetical protein
VLDRDCCATEVDSLYVVDARFVLSMGAVNPALTAMAKSRGSATICLKQRTTGTGARPCLMRSTSTVS